MPDKLESLSLSGSAWIGFSGTSGNSESDVVVSIWLVGICPCELLILGCFQISRVLRRKLQVCFVLQKFFFSLLSHSLLYIFNCGRFYEDMLFLFFQDMQRQTGTGISSTGEATLHLVCLLGEVRGRVQVLMFCHSCSVPR